MLGCTWYVRLNKKLCTFCHFNLVCAKLSCGLGTGQMRVLRKLHHVHIICYVLMLYVQGKIILSLHKVRFMQTCDNVIYFSDYILLTFCNNNIEPKS